MWFTGAAGCGNEERCLKSDNWMAVAMIFPELELQAPEPRWELRPDIGAKSREAFL
jgi:hypothetical protein